MSEAYKMHEHPFTQDVMFERVSDGLMMYPNGALIELNRLARELALLRAACKEILSAADQLVNRPPVDDSRQIDRDTRNLRDVRETVRAAIAKAEGGAA